MRKRRVFNEQSIEEQMEADLRHAVSGSHGHHYDAVNCHGWHFIGSGRWDIPESSDLFGRARS